MDDISKLGVQLIDACWIWRSWSYCLSCINRNPFQCFKSYVPRRCNERLNDLWPWMCKTNLPVTIHSFPYPQRGWFSLGCQLDKPIDPERLRTLGRYATKPTTHRLLSPQLTLQFGPYSQCSRQLRTLSRCVTNPPGMVHSNLGLHNSFTSGRVPNPGLNSRGKACLTSCYLTRNCSGRERGLCKVQLVAS